MIFPVIYAVLFWFLAAKYRRTWCGVLIVLAGLGLLALIGFTSIDGEQHPLQRRLGLVLPRGLQNGVRLLMVLLVPYGVMVGTVAVFLVSIPRAKTTVGCRKCKYDLTGLNPLGLVCPECGFEQGPYRCKRCAHDLRGRQPLGLKCPECGDAWKGPGSGREHEPEQLVPIPTQAMKKRRSL